jgi:hypothetical protein
LDLRQKCLSAPEATSNSQACQPENENHYQLIQEKQREELILQSYTILYGDSLNIKPLDFQTLMMHFSAAFNFNSQARVIKYGI